MPQTQLQDPPLLGPLLDRIVRRLPYEAARALAEAQPVADEKDDPIGDLMRLLQAKCRRRIDEPDFNEETRQAIQDVRAGVDVSKYESVDAMFADLGF